MTTARAERPHQLNHHDRITANIAADFQRAAVAFGFIGFSSTGRELQNRLLLLDNTCLQLTRWGVMLGLHTTPPQATWPEGRRFLRSDIVLISRELRRLNSLIETRGPPDRPYRLTLPAYRLPPDIILTSANFEMHDFMQRLILERIYVAEVMQRSDVVFELLVFSRTSDVDRLIRHVKDIVSRLQGLWQDTIPLQQSVCDFDEGYKASMRGTSFVRRLDRTINRHDDLLHRALRRLY